MQQLEENSENQKQIGALFTNKHSSLAAPTKPKMSLITEFDVQRPGQAMSVVRQKQNRKEHNYKILEY